MLDVIVRYVGYKCCGFRVFVEEVFMGVFVVFGFIVLVFIVYGFIYKLD